MKRFVKNMRTAGFVLLSSAMLITGAVPAAAYASGLEGSYEVAANKADLQLLSFD